MTRKVRTILISVAIIIATLALMGATLGWILSQQDALATQRQDSQQRHDALVSLRAQNAKLEKSNAKVVGQYANLYNQLQKLGVSPQSPTPAQVNSDTPTAAASGTGIEIVTCDANGAWHEHFSDGTVQVVQGPCAATNGKDGAGATDGQIAASVAAFCAEHNSCKGTDGTDGGPGQPGGAGSPGANGTSVTGISCIALADGSTAFEFTLTAGDGTTSVQDIPGPCTPAAPSTEGDTPNE